MPGQFLFILLFILVMAPFKTMGQVDPSAALLLRKGENAQKNYNPDRYTVRPLPKEEESKKEEVLPDRKPLESKASAQKAEEIPKVNPPEIVQPKQEEPKELIVIEPKSIAEYKTYLHFDDKRNNILEFSLGSNYIYQESSSKYWYRNYHWSSLGIEAEIDLWLSPFLGLNAQYITTLGSDIRGDTASTEEIDVEQNWFKVGIQFRKFFGISRKSKSVTLGLGLYESQFEVPTSADERMGLESKGGRISLEADLPINLQSSWTMGFEVLPSISHTEITNVADIKSGNSPSSSAMGIWVGRNLLLDRKNQLYFKVSHHIEKNRFSGDTHAVDPVSQSNYTGAGVTRGTTLLHMGFTWGR